MPADKERFPFVIASVGEAIQAQESFFLLDCFVASLLAMTEERMLLANITI